MLGAAAVGGALVIPAALGAAGAPAAMAAPTAPAAPLSRQDRVFLERGLRHGAWVMQEEMGWAPSPELFRDSDFTDPTWYDAPLWHGPLMEGLSDVPWSATKGPRGFHLDGSEEVPDQILTGTQKERADDLFTYCFGDEDNFSEALLAHLAELFPLLRREAPDALLHTNQYAFQWTDDQMKRFMQACRPDLLTFDSYYFSWTSQHASGSVTEAYNITARTRDLALLGNDLEGSSPLAFGQYSLGFRTGDMAWMEGYDYIVSQSRQYLAPNLTWILGGKWNDLFRWQHGEHALLTRADGSPTTQYERYRELNARMHVLSPYLTRLQTHTASIVPGASDAGPNPDSRLPRFTSETDPGTGLLEVSAENIGGANDGLPGDVVIGTFRPIQGLSPEQVGRFADLNTPAMMIMNGLVVPNVDPSIEDGVGGNAEGTRQRLTLSFSLGEGRQTGKLMTVDQRTGKERRIPVTHRSHGVGTAKVEVDGGSAQLLWWDLR